MGQTGTAALQAAVLAMPVLLALMSVEADAKMALRISVEPSSPLVGTPARVTVLTMAPLSEHCVYDARADMRPWSDWHPKGALSFELVAAAGGRSIPIPLRQRDGDPVYWDGDVVFPEAGAWTLRMVRPEWSGGNPEGEICAGARIVVPVRSSSAPPAVAGPPIGILAVASILAALLVGELIRRSRRRVPRSAPDRCDRRPRKCVPDPSCS
jgi:hypothetical protein